jgi:prevent-host-death family protein
MPVINIHAAKTHLSRLVDEAASGTEIVIARAGKPVARLVPLAEATTPQRRKLGQLSGQIATRSDFDAPLPDDILESFEQP